MWKRRKAELHASTLRYCQTAHELPLLELYEAPNFTVAVAQTCRRVDAPGNEVERYALGILHTEGSIWWDGSLGPLLPCRINFGIGYGDDPPFGLTELGLWNDKENPHYRLEIEVEDNGDLFSTLETALAHAKLSDRNFLHATFVKPRDAWPSRNASSSTPWEERVANREAMAQRIEDGIEKPANITLASVWFDDKVSTSTPTWATAWHDADSLSEKQFHDPRVAKARLRKKLPLPRRKDYRE